MRNAEVIALRSTINELRAEVKALHQLVDMKIDHVVRKVCDAFQGFGILDPNEETWTEQQVCERYRINRRTMYNFRKDDKIAFTKTGRGKNCKIYYRKADVIEFFASYNG